MANMTNSALLETPIAEIGLSVRTTSALEERGIVTIGDLVSLSREDLIRSAGLRAHMLESIERLRTQLRDSPE